MQKKNSLAQTNTYIKNAQKRRDLFATTISSSTAIEGVRIALKKGRKPSKKSH